MDISISQTSSRVQPPSGFFQNQVLLPRTPPTNGAMCFPINDNASPPPYSPPGYPGYDPTMPAVAPITQDARRCTDCQAFLDTDVPEFAKRCRDCYKVYTDAWVSMPKRNCRVCNERKISTEEPEWKQVCGACFREHGRKCVDCDKHISPTAPKYQTRCHGCFIAKRSLTHNQCPTCPPHLARHLRKLKADLMCTACKTVSGGGISRTAVPTMPNLVRTTTVA